MAARGDALFWAPGLLSARVQSLCEACSQLLPAFEVDFPKVLNQCACWGVL